MRGPWKRACAHFSRGAQPRERCLGAWLCGHNVQVVQRPPLQGVLERGQDGLGAVIFRGALDCEAPQLLKGRRALDHALHPARIRIANSASHKKSEFRLSQAAASRAEALQLAQSSSRELSVCSAGARPSGVKYTGCASVRPLVPPLGPYRWTC